MCDMLQYRMIGLDGQIISETKSPVICRHKLWVPRYVAVVWEQLRL